MKNQKGKINLSKIMWEKHKHKIIYLLMIILMCISLCACATNIGVNDSLSVEHSSDNSETEIIPLIEVLKFSVNDKISNSKPEDLYYQICDVHLSPVESLSVAEFIERAKESSMQLTYNICEDDVKWIFSDYNDNYLVTGGGNVEIFFYCEDQLVFKLVCKNLTDETLPLKNCYAFCIEEMHEYFSENAVDVKSRSWHCGGILFGGDGYSYTTIKEAFTNWGLNYEEEENNDGTITIYSSVINKEIGVDFQNKIFKESIRYYAIVDKTTSEVIKFYIRYF